MVAATVATHSRQAESLREALLVALEGIVPRSGDVPFLSTGTGGFVDTAELDAEYWYRNMRDPVQLERATRPLLDDGRRAFVEVSPHPVLTFGVRETIEHALEDPDEAVVVVSLRRDEGGLEPFLRSLAEVWVRGVQVDWDAVAVALVPGGCRCRPTPSSAGAIGGAKGGCRRCERRRAGCV